MNYIEMLEICSRDELEKEELLREIYQKREDIKTLEKLFQAEYGKITKGQLNKKLKGSETCEVYSAAATFRIKRIKKPVDVRGLTGLFFGTRS